MGCPWGTQPRSHLPRCVTIITTARHSFPRRARSRLSSPRLTEPPAGAGAAALGRSTAAPRPPHRGLRPLGPAGAPHAPPGSRSPAGGGRRGSLAPGKGREEVEGSPAPARPATAANTRRLHQVSGRGRKSKPTRRGGGSAAAQVSPARPSAPPRSPPPPPPPRGLPLPSGAASLLRLREPRGRSSGRDPGRASRFLGPGGNTFSFRLGTSPRGF